LITHWVDNQGNTGIIDHDITVIDGFVEGKPVLKPRAATACHVDSQFQIRIFLLLNQLPDLARGGIGECHSGCGGRFNLNHGYGLYV
jgi:hypothetical protein